MKIILSRKGFDSGKKTGNGASPFVKNKEMMSFPIPAERAAAFANIIRYDGVRFPDGATMKQRMEELRQGKPKWGPSLSVDAATTTRIWFWMRGTVRRKTAGGEYSDNPAPSKPSWKKWTGATYSFSSAGFKKRKSDQAVCVFALALPTCTRFSATYRWRER